MSILYFCDHCGEKINRWVCVSSDPNRGMFGVRNYHICDDCFEEFKKLMKEEPEEPFIQTSEGKKRFFKR